MDEDFCTDGGFIVSYRRSADGDIHDDMATWALWQHLLHKAEWRPIKRQIDGKLVEVERGSLYFNAANLALKWKVHRSVVDRALKYLEETGRIARLSRRRGSIITIRKFYIYQDLVKQIRGGSASQSEGYAEAEQTQAGGCAEATRRLSPNTPIITRSFDPLTREPGNQGTREPGNQKTVPEAGKPTSDGGDKVVPLFPEETPAKDIAPEASNIDADARSTPTPSKDVGKPKKTRERTPFQDLCLATWERYAAAFFSRWQTEPVRDARANQAIVSFCKRLGAESPDVIEFYVGHSKPSYVANCHPLNFAVADAQAIRTQWATGRKISTQEARRAETDDKNKDVFRRALERGGPAKGGPFG